MYPLLSSKNITEVSDDKHGNFGELYLDDVKFTIVLFKINVAHLLICGLSKIIMLVISDMCIRRFCVY